MTSNSTLLSSSRSGTDKLLPLQEDDYMCGPSSLQKALSAQGLVVSQELVAKACGTTIDGSDEEDIKRGILHFGFTYDEYQTDIWNEAIHWLDSSLGLYGAPALLCVRVEEAWDHWVCVYGGLGPQGGMRYNVFDPISQGRNLYEAGHNMYTGAELRKYWRAPYYEREGEGLAYYGISVHGREGRKWWQR